MAEGEWVPAFTSLWRGPKAARLAAELYGRPGILQRRHAAGGLFLELLSWALDACESGDLGTVAPAVLAAAVGLEGGGRVGLAQRGVALLEALKAAGFVSADERAHVLGWDDGPGKLIARRARERERKRARRAVAPPLSGLRDTVAPPLLRRLSGGQGSGVRGVVPADRGPIHAQNPSSRPGMSGGRPPDATRVVPWQSREEKKREEPPYPPRGSAGQAALNSRRPGEMTVEPHVAAAFVIEGAAEPWRSALEAFGARRGMTALVTWFAGGTFRVRDGVAELVLLNEFQADFVREKFLTELRASLPDVSELRVSGRRRAMGEPGVLR